MTLPCPAGTARHRYYHCIIPQAWQQAKAWPRRVSAPKQRSPHGGDEPDVFRTPGRHRRELRHTGRAKAKHRLALAKAPLAESTRHPLTPTASIDRSSTVYSPCKSPVLGGSAAGPCLWLGFDVHPPHEHGVGALRFVPIGAVEGIDRGRPKSRSLPPAAILGAWGPRENGGQFPKKGFSRDRSLERVRAEPAVPPAGWQGKQGAAEGSERWLLRVRKIVKRRGPFSVPRRACQPFLMGKAPDFLLSPATTPKSGAPL